MFTLTQLRPARARRKGRRGLSSRKRARDGEKGFGVLWDLGAHGACPGLIPTLKGELCPLSQAVPGWEVWDRVRAPGWAVGSGTGCGCGQVRVRGGRNQQ